jgi:hypothetical protein
VVISPTLISPFSFPVNAEVAVVSSVAENVDSLHQKFFDREVLHEHGFSIQGNMLFTGRRQIELTSLSFTRLQGHADLDRTNKKFLGLGKQTVHHAFFVLIVLESCHCPVLNRSA